MGVYSEVFFPCPECKTGRGYMQISGVRHEMERWSMPDDTDLLELTEDELVELKRRILEDDFVCGGDSGILGREDGCGHVFNPYKTGVTPEEQDAKRKLVNDMFGGDL